MSHLAAGTLKRPSTIGIEAVRAKWGWVVALGLIYLITGVVALGSVVMATVTTVYFVGIMMLISGFAEVINAFQVRTWSKFFFWAILGTLYIIAGVVTFQNPLLAATFLTLLLGFSLVASGIMRIVLAFSMREGTAWAWVLLSGLVTLLLGFVILYQWPFSSLYILGLLLGIDLIFAGAGWTSVGLRLRKA
jgi:uncharacterized membrane protein HdeD (DUF308 family)